MPHLDALVEVLFKVGGVHDAIFDRLGAVEDELVLDLLLGSALALGGGLFDSGDSHFETKLKELRKYKTWPNLEKKTTRNNEKAGKGV